VSRLEIASNVNIYGGSAPNFCVDHNWYCTDNIDGRNLAVTHLEIKLLKSIVIDGVVCTCSEAPDPKGLHKK